MLYSLQIAIPINSPLEGIVGPQPRERRKLEGGFHETSKDIGI